MALRVLFSLAAWGFGFLVIVSVASGPHGVHGFGRGWPWFGPRKGIVEPSDAGICAASVLPYGYKCHELQVSKTDALYLSIYTCV